MAHSLPADLTSTLQSLSLNPHPSPTHDLNPSTAASTKIPLSPKTSPTKPVSSSPSSSIPSEILHPLPRRAPLPPLPDLRFEQSYLASIKDAHGFWGVAWVTGRDQVLMPLVQGVVWNLALVGWRYWNRGAVMQGQGMGARVRRWWWGVNGWKIPEVVEGGKGSDRGGGKGRARFVERVAEYFTAQAGAGAGD